jgi:hypothetical protein
VERNRKNDRVTMLSDQQCSSNVHLLIILQPLRRLLDFLSN